MVIHHKFNAMRSRKSTVQSYKYYTVQLREKNGHSNITVNRNYYGQRLASKLLVFDRKSNRFFLRVFYIYYIYIIYGSVINILLQNKHWFTWLTLDSVINHDRFLILGINIDRQETCNVCLFGMNMQLIVR